VWTDTTRAQFARSDLRLPSDLTDAEWAVLEPLLPARSHRGRPAKWTYRQIVEAMLYLLRGGLHWRMLPPGIFPPATTVQRKRGSEALRDLAGVSMSAAGFQHHGMSSSMRLLGHPLTSRVSRSVRCKRGVAALLLQGSFDVLGRLRA